MKVLYFLRHILLIIYVRYFWGEIVFIYDEDDDFDDDDWDDDDWDDNDDFDDDD